MHIRIILIVFSLLFSMNIAVYAEEKPTTAQFVKLDEQARVLAIDAPLWAMVRDETTGLIWEVKTTDGSIHDNQAGYDWAGAHDIFIAQLNEMQFGGFSDWRLPITSELRTIRVKGVEPYINQDFFPHTIPSSYMSWRKCGSGDIYNERVKFGKMRNKKINRQIRAVRGGSIPKTEEEK